MNKNVCTTNTKHNNTSSKKESPSKYTEYLSQCEKYNVISVLIVIIAVLVLLVIGFDECKTCFNRLETKENAVITEEPLKTYWVYGRNVESGFLKNLFVVLDRLGYRNDPNATDWDLLWAHDYPFRSLYPQIKDLKPHQRINHFPGCGYITNKVDLATSGLKYIPPAFKLPTDKTKLLKFAEENPLKKFVQKNNDHRNITIQNLSDVNLNSEGTFIQEFVDKPLLVSGYKFDIGIYTIITSIDPLRVYIYNGDALLRFCPEKYYPFDAKVLDKYVVGDDYLPPWDVPDLAYYYKELGFGMKESLNAFISKSGKNPRVIWDQIEDSLRIVLVANEPKIADVANRFKSKSNFFEMMRFDFVVDEDLKVYLMEANMSPNLSSAHFPPNQLMFEQIIFNLMGLVGIGERIRRSSLAVRSRDEELMLSANRNIAVFSKDCSSELCRSSCVSPNCQLCLPCLSERSKKSLLQAFREHLNKGDCKRIFPPTMQTQTADLPIDFQEYSAENQLQYRWFQGKCLLDPSWCN